MIKIPIIVPTGPIKAAIDEVKRLHGVIGNTPPISGDPTQSRHSETVKQMQEFLRPGTSGIAGMAAMDATTRRIAQNLQTWQTAASKARAELKQLSDDIKGLEKASLDPSLKASTRGVMLDELSQLQARRKEVEREAIRATARAESYERRLPDSNYLPPQNQPDQRNQRSWSGVRRLMGYGLAAAGGFSVASMLGSARGAYLNNLGEESLLHARGLGSFRDVAGLGTGLGYSPTETYGLLGRLSAGTGLNEKGGIGKHAALSASFARFTGVGLDDVANVRQGIYQATGNAGNIPSSVLLAIGRSTADGLDKSKMSILLQEAVKNIGLSAQAMRGAGLSRAQLAADMAFAITGSKLDGQRGVFARSQEFSNVMQNGLQGAGTGAGDVILFKAMGGFDGPMTWEKIHQMNLIKQGGFMERPDLMQNILGNLSGTRAARAGQLETMFPNWNLGAKGAETLLTMHDKGFFSRLARSNKTMLQQLESEAKGGGEAARWLAEIKANPAFNRQTTEATKDAIRIEAGERLAELFQPLELSAAKLAGALADGDWKRSFSVLGTAAGEMGPAAKTMAGAATLFAIGGALSAVGGLTSLGKGGAGLLPKLAPFLNPTTAGIAALGATFGAIGWAGADNDQNLKRGQSDQELRNRYHQLEVAGAQFGPEGQRIKAELQRRQQGGAATQPKPRGWFQHQDKIRYSSQAYGVPLPILAGLLESESGISNVPMRTEHYANGKPFRVGGIAQFTDETARDRGVDPMNPASAIPGAAKYLRELYDKTGSWSAAVEKYKGISSGKNLWMRDTALFKAQKYNDQVDPQTAATVQGLAPAGSQGLGADNTSIVALLQQILGASLTTADNTGKQPTTTLQPLPVSN